MVHFKYNDYTEKDGIKDKGSLLEGGSVIGYIFLAKICFK